MSPEKLFLIPLDHLICPDARMSSGNESSRRQIPILKAAFDQRKILGRRSLLGQGPIQHVGERPLAPDEKMLPPISPSVHAFVAIQCDLVGGRDPIKPSEDRVPNGWHNVRCSAEN
jgi:hypothetical protein